MKFNKKTKKILAVTLVVGVLMAIGVVGCFAAEIPTTALTYVAETPESVIGGIGELTQGLLSTFTFANIVKFLGVTISAAGLLALGWFGLRKCVSMIQTALKRGKVKI